MKHIKLHVPKVSKGKLTIALISLVVLALVVGGLAAYQKNQQDKAKQATIAREESIKAENARKAEVDGLKAQISKLQTEKTAACVNYKALSTARSTRSLVVVPLAVNCPQ